MKPLNIPLTGSHQTARRDRRAVWRWGVPMMVILLLWMGARLHGTRNPFMDTIPEETSIMIHLRPTRAQWSALLERAGSEILTTSLTLKELAPFVRGSLAIFITKDASPVIGFEGFMDEEAQRKLESHGFAVERIGRNLYLLGEEPVSLAPSAGRAGSIERLLPKFAGSIVNFDTGAPHATIRVRGDNVSLSVPGAARTELTPLLNERVIFAGTFSPKTPLLFPKAIDEAFSFLSGGTTLEDILKNEQTEGALSLFDDGSYLLSLSSDLPQAMLQKLLTLQYQLQEPKITVRQLRDGTRVNELRLKEVSPVPEEIENDDWTILRLESEYRSFFAGKKKDGSEVFFTDSADALIQKTTLHAPSKPLIACGNSQNLQIRNKKFFEYLQTGLNHFSTPLPLSNTDFVYVGMDKNIFGVKMRLCGDKTGA